MPDQRKHRGPHPGDRQRFAAENVPRLRGATHDLSWLLSRGYASTSALKLVGDRFSLDARQRKAVARCACSGDASARRKRHEVRITDLANRTLWIDGYNVLTSVEAALSGGVILSAAYALWLYRRVVMGDLIKESLKSITDMTIRERAIFAPLVVMTILLGIYPALVLDLIGPSVTALVANYDTALLDSGVTTAVAGY